MAVCAVSRIYFNRSYQLDRGKMVQGIKIVALVRSTHQVIVHISKLTFGDDWRIRVTGGWLGCPSSCPDVILNIGLWERRMLIDLGISIASFSRDLFCIQAFWQSANQRFDVGSNENEKRDILRHCVGRIPQRIGCRFARTCCSTRRIIKSAIQYSTSTATAFDRFLIRLIVLHGTAKKVQFFRNAYIFIALIMLLAWIRDYFAVCISKLFTIYFCIFFWQHFFTQPWLFSDDISVITDEVYSNFLIQLIKISICLIVYWNWISSSNLLYFWCWLWEPENRGK